MPHPHLHTSASETETPSATERISNIHPSKKTEEDWSIQDAENDGVLPPENAPLPASVDYRAAWWTIGNQMDTGSCIGWALGDGVLRWHLVDAKRIADTQRISPRYIWMASKELDLDNARPTSFLEKSGTTLKDALRICHKYGIAMEDDLPFRGMLNKEDENTFFNRIAATKICGYYNLFSAGDKVKNLKRWLASRGPVFASLITDDSWLNILPDGKLLKYTGKTGTAAHAIALVGYNAQGFIIRNSYGTQWADQGFAYAGEAYVRAAFDEAYGLVI